MNTPISSTNVIALLYHPDSRIETVGFDTDISSIISSKHG